MFRIEQQRKWRRPTEVTGKFPTDKYAFSIHLTKTGDWVETDSLHGKAVKNIIDAAHAWAWVHGVTVRCVSKYAPDGGKYVRVTLTKKHRHRDYA